MDGIVIQLVIMATFGVVCAMVASNRGRSGVGWFLIGAILGCIGLIILLVIPNLKLEAEKYDSLRRSNRRLRERLRKDRQVADTRHDQTVARLDIHDEAAGIDTSPAIASKGSARVGSGIPQGKAVTGRRWYYLVDNERTGPITDAQLKRLWKGGEIGPATQVWTQATQDWKAIQAITGLEAQLDA